MNKDYFTRISPSTIDWGTVTFSRTGVEIVEINTDSILVKIHARGAESIKKLYKGDFVELD